MRRMLLSAMGILSATTIAIPFFIQVQPALGKCQVSSTALEVANLTNKVRNKYGLTPLQFNCRLYNAAQNHTIDMVKMKKISHTGSDGSDVSTRAKRVGYQYSYVGENVAQGQKSPSEVIKSWMESKGHRQNILNPNYTDIGVGYSNNYWTQVFGREQ